MADPPVSSAKKRPKFTDLNDLAGNEVGGIVLFATDEWFGTADNLLKSETPQWKEGMFTEYGKWMDGWETRRKRIEGHDWCVIQLGLPGVIEGVDVDTSYFTGNYAPRFSLQAVCLDSTSVGRQRVIGTAASAEDFRNVDKLGSENWEYIVSLTQLQPGYKTCCHNYLPSTSRERYTHLRLNIYPDGGIARLRVHGIVIPDWSSVAANEVVDLVAMENGGMCVAYSNSKFSHPRNLTKPGRALTMGDGWETARKATRPAILQANSDGVLQVPGMDSCVFRLGHPGIIKKIEIDTNHFKGNFPDSCRIEACCIEKANESSALEVTGEHPWRTLLPFTKLSPHTILQLDEPAIQNLGVISHVRLIIAPDGGISRLRLWGVRETQRFSKL